MICPTCHRPAQCTPSAAGLAAEATCPEEGGTNCLRAAFAGTGTPIVDLVCADWPEARMAASKFNQHRDYKAVAEALEKVLFGALPYKLLRARDAKGRATYGHPLRADTRKPDGSRYNWREEAAEELADALLYLRAAIEEEANHGA